MSAEASNIIPIGEPHEPKAKEEGEELCAFKGVLFDWKGTLEPKTPKQDGKRPDKLARVQAAVEAVHSELESAGFGGGEGGVGFREVHDETMANPGEMGLVSKGKLVSVSMEKLKVTQSDPSLARRLEELYLETIRGPTDNRALYPGAVELLQKLKARGVPVALIRNSRLPKETFMKNLEEAGVSHLFDAVVMSGDVGHEKPAAPIFHHAISALGLHHVHQAEPHSLVFVGNETEADVMGAKAMGWKSVLLTSTEPHSNGLADYEVSSMEELHTVLFPSPHKKNSPPSSSSSYFQLHPHPQKKQKPTSSSVGTISIPIPARNNDPQSTPQTIDSNQ